MIIANLKARRLTLVYGESGVGKSSLLRAGVASQLLEAAEEDISELGSPEFIPIVVSAWRDDALTGLVDEIHVWLHPLLVGPEDPADLITHTRPAARLELVEVQQFDSGLLILVYRPVDAAG